MATVNEFYKYLEQAIPAELSYEWDNDGRMCVPFPDGQVKRVLVCLDINDKVVDYAIDGGFDCIVSHHPLIFSGIKRIDGNDTLGARLCRLIKNDIAAFSFHTRLDRVSGGVNDALADAIGLKSIRDFSDIGKMGEVDETSLREFAVIVKSAIGSDRVICIDGGVAVKRVALVGGSGKDYIGEAIKEGCDTFITGEMAYNYEQDCAALGLNAICGGHYFTENVVCDRLKLLIEAFDGGIEVEAIGSNPGFAL